MTNKLSKYIVSSWTFKWSHISRNKTSTLLKNELTSRYKGNGTHSIGVYVKVAEFPDNLSNTEIQSIISKIERDYEEKKN